MPNESVDQAIVVLLIEMLGHFSDSLGLVENCAVIELTILVKQSSIPL